MESDRSRPTPLKMATERNVSMLPTEMPDARGRSLWIAALMSLSKKMQRKRNARQEEQAFVTDDFIRSGKRVTDK